MVDVEKIKTICAYLALNVDDLFVTKLMKFFYYLDFISFKQRSASITNDTYYKLPYGPVPSFIKNEVDNLLLPSSFLLQSGQLSDTIELEEKVIGKAKGYVIKAKTKKADLKSLSNFEIDLLKKVVSKLKDKTASTLSEMTHKEMPYMLTSDNSIISYELAYQLDIDSILK